MCFCFMCVVFFNDVIVSDVVLIVFMMFSMLVVIILSLCCFGGFILFIHVIVGVRMDSSVELSGRRMAHQRLQQLLRAQLRLSKRNCRRAVGAVLWLCTSVMY